MLIDEFKNQFIYKDNYAIEKSPIHEIIETKKNSEIAEYLPKIIYSQVPISISSKTVSAKRRRLLIPIERFEEYESLLNRILEYKVPDNVSYLTKFIPTEGYEKSPIELLGLVSYCGRCDKSNEINRWLSGRPSTQSTLPDEEMANIVRVLDYSLKKLDEKYGKYEGIVYRIGFFNPNTDNQFYSTSLSSKYVTKHCFNPQDTSDNNVLSIIKVKNGHKICNFQQDVNSKISRRFAENEEEILIDRNSKFRKIPEEEYTEEDKELKRKLIAKYFDFKGKLYEQSPEWKSIDIWEEI